MCLDKVYVPGGLAEIVPNWTILMRAMIFPTFVLPGAALLWVSLKEAAEVILLITFILTPVQTWVRFNYRSAVDGEVRKANYLFHLSFSLTLGCLLVTALVRCLQDFLLWPGTNFDLPVFLGLLAIGLVYHGTFVVGALSLRHLPDKRLSRQLLIAACLSGIGVTFLSANQLSAYSRPTFEISHQELIGSLISSQPSCLTYLKYRNRKPLPRPFGMPNPRFYTDENSFVLAYAMYPDDLNGSTVYYDSRQKKWHYIVHAECDCCIGACPIFAFWNTVSKMELC